MDPKQNSASLRDPYTNTAIMHVDRENMEPWTRYQSERAFIEHGMESILFLKQVGILKP